MFQIKIMFILLTSSIISCSKECDLEPIPENVFDLQKIKDKNLYAYGDEIEKSSFLSEHNNYEKKSSYNLNESENCGHRKGYVCVFKNEVVAVNLDKTDDGILKLFLVGQFPVEKPMLIVTTEDLVNEKEFIFNRKTTTNSSKSHIKQVVLKGGRIISITTTDDKKWSLK